MGVDQHEFIIILVCSATYTLDFADVMKSHFASEHLLFLFVQTLGFGESEVNFIHFFYNIISLMTLCFANPLNNFLF